MFVDRNYREWSIWKRSSPLEVTFALVTKEITDRASWLKQEIYWFLVFYSAIAIPMAIGNAIYEHWSFNSIVLLIMIAFPIWFCFKLREEVKKIYLDSGPTISD